MVTLSPCGNSQNFMYDDWSGKNCFQIGLKEAEVRIKGRMRIIEKRKKIQL